MPTPAIAMHALNKSYGKRSVLKDVSFTVNEGEVYALVGPNGAGKTTIIRMVAGLAFPSSGGVEILGKDPHKEPSVRRHLGAVVEAPAAFYPYLSGRENLALHAELAGGVPRGRIEEVLNLMELHGAGDRKVGVYSLGMRQRLGVASALLTKPKVLILDEPASGMDPLSLHLVHSVLRRAAESGTAVLLSTHHLDEVVAYCTRVAIMEEGRIIDEVNLQDRRERYRLRVTNVGAALELLSGEKETVSHATVRGAELIIIPRRGELLGDVSMLLARGGVGVLELNPDVFDLRAYYRERVEEERARRTGQLETRATSPGSIPSGTPEGGLSEAPLGTSDGEAEGGAAR